MTSWLTGVRSNSVRQPLPVVKLYCGQDAMSSHRKPFQEYVIEGSVSKYQVNIIFNTECCNHWIES